MYWHQSHQLSPFNSIAPRQVAFTHDFAEILRRLFLLWRHNFVTWPDPTKFFSPKVAQRMPHKLWKISARSSKRCGVQLRKTHGGVASTPPPDRARVNRAKTRGFWIGRYCSRTDSICPEISISWERGAVNYLGVNLTTTYEELGDINYPEKIERLRTKLNPWFGRGLTAYGKIHVIKSEALSQLIYLMTVLEKPNASLLKKIDLIVFHFIWNKGRDKVKRAVLRNNHFSGGLKVPDPSVQADCLKMVWIKKLLDDEHRAKWKNIIQPRLRVSEEISLLQCDVKCYKSLIRVTGCKFWAEVMGAWMTIVRASGSKLSGEQILAKVIWHNVDMNLEGNKTVNKRQLIERKAIQVSDLYDYRSRKLLNVNQLLTKFAYGHFLTWRSVLHAIPRSWKEILAQERPTIMRHAEAYDDLKAQKSTSKWCYKVLLSQSAIETPLNAQKKWENKLGGLDQEKWSEIHRNIYTTTDDFKLRWLQFRILHRILPTNRLLHLYGIKDSDQCLRCQSHTEDILHLFWLCPVSRSFWSKLGTKVLIRQLTEKHVITNTYSATQHDEALSVPASQLCPLLAKQYIWQSRYALRTLSVHGFAAFVRRYSDVERCVAVSTNTLTEFNKMWPAMLSKLDVT